MEDAGLLIYLNFSLKEYFSDFNSEGDFSSTHTQLFIFTSYSGMLITLKISGMRLMRGFPTSAVNMLPQIRIFMAGYVTHSSICVPRI